MKSHIGFWVGALFSLVVGWSGPAFAVQETADIPDVLRPWTEWVLRGHEQERCPFFSGNAQQRQCVWPSRLTLDFEQRGGRFTQQWVVHRDGWVSLPGDSHAWPQDVRVDGKPVPVTLHDGIPQVRLVRGSHTVAGNYEWDALPEWLPVPPATGLLALSLKGQRVPSPHRDNEGRLWLQPRAAAPEEADALDVVVHRRVVDEVPLQLVTRVELRVAGAGREVMLGKALPAEFVPMALETALPARVEPDGRLRVQVRPGNWTLALTARNPGPVNALTLPAADGAWDAEEVWVFDARNQLRLVNVEGVPTVDPQQTNLPEDWKHFPAYRMRPGDTMTLTQKQRGDSEPAPDRLSLYRTWWLSFDGGGYTLSDSIRGTMSRSWRLDLLPPAVLGRVAIENEDQFITRLEDTPASGVEIRQGNISLSAESQLNGTTADVPAVGWNQDFQQVDGVLKLPPGWTLLHAGGVDDAAPTWVATWTLLDLFVVLIIALAAAKLWGKSIGVLALFTLGLTYIEPGAPRGVWLALLAAEALVRVLPAGRLLKLCKLARLAALVFLVISAVPFMVSQVRQAMYPALISPLELRRQFETSSQPVFQEELAKEAGRGDAQGMVMAKRLAGKEPMTVTAQKREYQPEIDPKAIVQTGPGLPTWEWTRVSLHWRGPVERGQRMHLWLLSPSVNFVLALVRVLLLAGLALVVLRAGADGLRAGLSIAAVVLLMATIAGPAAAEIPSPNLLEELRTRLLKPPDCHPDCATIPRLQLEISRATLRGRMTVDVAADSAVPLPGSGAHWTPDSVLVEGQPVPALMRDSGGVLWLQLPAGKHVVLIAGELGNRESVPLPLPLKPQRVEARVEGWRLDGLREDGLADDNLQLSRLAGAGEAPSGTALQPGTLPPFVRVQRELHLGLNWEVVTTVWRVTPPGAAIVLELPLLAGESVTSSEVRVAAGKAQVSMAPQATWVAWRSILPQTPMLTLRAPEFLSFTEVWQLDVSPMWHVGTDGIPTVQSAPNQQRTREWQPWPGESVTIAVSRPAGVPGPTLTIDGSVVGVSPGTRATDVTLQFDARSSQGGQHVITLPDGADLQSVRINEIAQPIRQEGRRVMVPLVPDKQSFQLAWRQPGGVRSRLLSPEINLGAPSVNSVTQILMPADRWTLAVGGPRMGPAVLFWSLLAVVVLAALGLGRVPLTPLHAPQWVLLGVGLTQVPIELAVLVAGWLLALGWRQRRGGECSDRVFDALQILLAIWSVAALAGLVWSVQQGLLGQPEMQIAGSGSSARMLHWYQDRAGEILPRAWVISVPLWCYRLLMLAWALWLAQALLAWLRWGWECFNAGGLWRPMRRKVVASANQSGMTLPSA